MKASRFLFTGDANGKERFEDGDVDPTHVEGRLLELERRHPGVLRADVLKVPHHGSESASTQAFIDAVNPDWVIISASTMHDLPRASVVARYEAAHRRILTTMAQPANNLDHIVCRRRGTAPVDCNFKWVWEED